VRGRPGRDLNAGERVVVRKGEKYTTENGRTAIKYDVRFPDAPTPSAADVLRLDESTTDAETKPANEDKSIPF
jgi:hypothetical protein